MKSVMLGTVSDLRDKKCRKFFYKVGKENREGVMVYSQGKFYAYFNRCRHVSLPLDWGDEDFLTEDGRYILCRNHGALYEPSNGDCVSGPCAGQALESVKIQIKQGKIFIKSA